MITEATRLCGTCRRLLPEPPAAPVCAACSRVAVPLHTEWPKGMKRWLLGQLVRQFFAPWARATDQYRWEQLLRAVVAGRQWGVRLVPFASAVEDCYPVALQQLTQWEAAGSPSLYT